MQSFYAMNKFHRIPIHEFYAQYTGINQKVSIFEISIKLDIWSTLHVDNKSFGRKITSGEKAQQKTNHHP